MLLFNDSIQMVLITAYRAFHPNTHKMFSKINCMVENKASLSKNRYTERASSALVDHRGIKLGINSNSNYRKHTNS